MEEWWEIPKKAYRTLDCGIQCYNTVLLLATIYHIWQIPMQLHIYYKDKELYLCSILIFSTITVAHC